MMLKRLPNWMKWIIYVLWFPWAFLRVAYYAWIRHENEDQLRRRFPVDVGDTKRQADAMRKLFDEPVDSGGDKI